MSDSESESQSSNTNSQVFDPDTLYQSSHSSASSQTNSQVFDPDTFHHIYSSLSDGSFDHETNWRTFVNYVNSTVFQTSEEAQATITRLRNTLENETATLSQLRTFRNSFVFIFHFQDQVKEKVTAKFQ